jgi:hypothetical protein
MFSFSLIEMAEAQRLDARREWGMADLAKQLQPFSDLLNAAVAA